MLYKLSTFVLFVYKLFVIFLRIVAVIMPIYLHPFIFVYVVKQPLGKTNNIAKKVAKNNKPGRER